MRAHLRPARVWRPVSSTDATRERVVVCSRFCAALDNEHLLIAFVFVHRPTSKGKVFKGTRQNQYARAGGFGAKAQTKDCCRRRSEKRKGVRKESKPIVGIIQIAVG